MKGYILEYVNENKFRKLERALKKYNIYAYKKLNFDYYPSLRSGIFLGKLISTDSVNETETYELRLPSDLLFTQVHGEVKLKYIVYKAKNIVILDTITPTDVLLEGHVNELSTYKGVMISKQNAEKDKFMINLFSSLDKGVHKTDFFDEYPDEFIKKVITKEKERINSKIIDCKACTNGKDEYDICNHIKYFIINNNYAEDLVHELFNINNKIIQLKNELDGIKNKLPIYHTHDYEDAICKIDKKLSPINEVIKYFKNSNKEVPDVLYKEKNEMLEKKKELQVKITENKKINDEIDSKECEIESNEKSLKNLKEVIYNFHKDIYEEIHNQRKEEYYQDDYK